MMIVNDGCTWWMYVMAAHDGSSDLLQMLSGHTESASAPTLYTVMDMSDLTQGHPLHARLHKIL